MFDFFGLENNGSQVGVVSPTSGALRMPFTDMDLVPAVEPGPGRLRLPGRPGRDAVERTDRLDLHAQQLGYLVRRRLLIGAHLRLLSIVVPAATAVRPGLNRNGYRLDKIIGYRYFGFDESLGISGVFVPPTGRIVANDLFSTQNRFHGVDVGLGLRSRPWSLVWSRRSAGWPWDQFSGVDDFWLGKPGRRDLLAVHERRHLQSRRFHGDSGARSDSGLCHHSSIPCPHSGIRVCS